MRRVLSILRRHLLVGADNIIHPIGDGSCSRTEFGIQHFYNKFHSLRTLRLSALAPLGLARYKTRAPLARRLRASALNLSVFQVRSNARGAELAQCGTKGKRVDQFAFAPRPNGVESMAIKQYWRHFILVLASIVLCIGVIST